MPLYSYRVKDRAGNTRTGNIEAESERAAAAMIRDAGGLPLEIRPVGIMSAQSEKPAASPFVHYVIHPLWTGVNIRALLFFYRQLATLLASGMSLGEALGGVTSRTGGALGRILRQAQNRVQNGGRLSDEMARHPRVFLPLQISLIRAGEETGLLESMADRLASYLEYEMSIRRRIVMATFYPILIFVFILFKPALITWIMKSTDAAVAVMMARLNAVAVPLVVLTVMCKLLFQFEPVRYVWDTVKILPPVLGTVARKIAMSRFSKAMALLYSAGVPVSKAVSIAADASANVAIGNALKRAIPALNQGEPLTESLQRTGAMLPMVLDMMAVGEKTGSYEVTLQKVADYMDAEADSTIQKLSIGLFVLMILVAGFLTLMDLLAGYSGYANQFSGPAN